MHPQHLNIHQLFRTPHRLLTMTTTSKRQNQNSHHIGKAMKRIQRLDRNHKKIFQAGFGLTEVVPQWRQALY